MNKIQDIIIKTIISDKKYLKSVGILNIEKTTYNELPAVFMKVTAMFHQGWLAIIPDTEDFLFNIILFNNYNNPCNGARKIELENIPEVIFTLTEKPTNITKEQYRNLVRYMEHYRTDFLLGLRN